jgi:asparagine synthase (glutamine-hydrolysing)
MLLGAAADEPAGDYSVGYSDGDGWGDFLAALRVMSRNGAVRRHPDLMPWTSIGGRSLVKDATLGVPDDVYPEYLRWEWVKVQQYNCWHEDRTAAGSGIEARVPFLDHRLVELTASLPAPRRDSLLWDKRIVREAARPFLPPHIVDREKVPFYHGKGRSYTQRTFARMLAGQGGELLEEALAAPGAAEFLAADAIRATAAAAQDSAESVGELLLRLVNVGLLAAMAEQQPDTPLQTRAQLASPPPELRDWQPALAGAAHDGDLEAALGCQALDPSTWIALADGVQLLATPDDARRYYIAVNGTVEYELDADTPVWLSMFQSITGEVPVSSLCQSLETPDGMLAPVLVEAIDLGLIRVLGDMAAPGSHSGSVKREGRP